MASAALALATAGALTLAGATAADAVVLNTTDANGVVYTIDDANPAHVATVTGYTGGSHAQLAILSTVSLAGVDYSVTSIGSFAFMDSLLAGKVIVPDSVTTISNSAFSCAGLTGVDLGHGVQTIGQYAFRSLGCFNPASVNALGAVTIPDSVSSIAAYAFTSTGITALTLGSGLLTVGDSAFRDNSYTAIDLRNLQHVGYSSFRDAQLTAVTIPASVIDIGAGAFRENPLTMATFEGAAPSITDTSAPEPSFPVAAALRFPWRLGASAGVANGYTTPTWKGYNTTAVATVTFDPQDGNPSIPASVDVGSTVGPMGMPGGGPVFRGWFTDAAATTLYDFSTPVAGDFTLYAGWAPAVVNPPVSPTQPTPPAKVETGI